MTTRYGQQALLLATALAVGLVALWLGYSVLGFLPLLILLILYLPRRNLRYLGIFFGAGLLLSGLTAVAASGEVQQLALALVVFFAAAFCIALGISGNGMYDLRMQQSERLPNAKESDHSAEGSSPETEFHEEDRDAAAFASSRAFWTDVAQVMSLRVRQPDGSFKWTGVRSEPGGAPAVPVKDLDTSRYNIRRRGIQCTGTANADVIAAAKNIEHLFGNGWAFDANGRWIYLPDFAQTTLGVTPEQLNEAIEDGTCAWERLLHPDERDRVTEQWLNSMSSGSPFNAEFRIRRKTGYAWARSAARAVRDSSGSIVGWYGTSLDIDVQRRTIEALHERERELLQLVNVVPNNIWRLGGDGEPNFFNVRMTEYLGLNVTDLDRPGLTRLQAMIDLAVHPDDHDAFEQALTASLETGKGFDLRYRLKRFDGVYRWMSSRASAMDGIDGRIIEWYGVCHDIDDQVRAEEALQRTERHVQRLIDAFPVHVWSWTPDGRLSYINQRFLDDLDVPVATFDELRNVSLSRVHPDDVARVAEHVGRELPKENAFSFRYKRLHRNGSYRWTEARFEPVRAPDGHIAEWYGMSIDVDDEMKVQQALRQRERSLEQLVETLPALIYCADPEGKPIYRSQKLQEYLGFQIEDKDHSSTSRLMGTLEAIIHPDDLNTVRERYTRSLSTGVPYTMKHRLRRFDGVYRWVETRAAAMLDEGGEIIQWNGVCLDIDDLIRAQEELVLAQRNLARASQAASMAELTASIAHEVGQPLAALLSSSDACQRWLSLEPPNLDRANRALERVVRSAHTATAVVTRIRALFRHSNDDRSLTSFAAVVADARDLMIEEAVRRKVRVQLNIDEHTPEVVADRVQIQQVLVNLVRNAMDALDAGATDRVVEITVEAEHEGLRVAVRDTGQGIQHPDQIFEPFFTTKAEGMGMGLAICRSIIEGHGGRLWAENNPERGATFFFTMPSAKALDAA